MNAGQRAVLQLPGESSPRDSLVPRSSCPSSHHHMEANAAVGACAVVRPSHALPARSDGESEALRASSSQICTLSHPGSLVNTQKRLREINTTAYFLSSLISRV